MKRFALAVALFLIILPLPAFAQSSNANLSGTVTDAGKAFIPGVSVSAANTETGVVSTAVSNETGTYSIPSLLPGTYKVSAELPGFQTQTYTNVQLGNAGQLRLNFTLQVASLSTAVEVTVEADRLLLESTSSVGAVLPQRTVVDLPITGVMGNDAVSGLIGTLPGINLSSDLVLAANSTMAAGVSAAYVNVTRDGVDASAAGRNAAGFQPATIMNPDMVGEVRMVTSPVDAELGRGNSQVQVQTRSGTNQYRGALVYNIRNSAIEPNSWANNRVQPTPIIPNWTNLNEYTGSVGGPIIKNKTFFFFLWDGLLPSTRANVNATVLSPCARNGIFRYFDGWQSGNSQAVTTTGGATPVTATVDQAGNILTPATNATGTGPFTGSLHYVSVFGKLPATLPAANADCSNISALLQPGTSWDPNRTQIDPTGYVQKIFGVMPAVNNYRVGDGLNTEGFQWTQSAHGANNRFAFGSAEVRKQLNIRIDHNFNSKNKINGGWSFERDHADYAQPQWPTQFTGVAHHQPQVLTVSFTSTLSATLLNEARFGMRRIGTNTAHALANPATMKAALAFIPNVQGTPVLPQLGMNAVGAVQDICICGGQPLFQGETGGTLFNGNISEKTPLFTYGDSITWTKGKHTFKGGGELRFGSSLFGDDIEGGNFSSFARAFGGDSPLAPTQNIDSTHQPGLQGTSTTGAQLYMRSLLSLLSGSLAQVTQLDWLANATDTKFSGYQTAAQRFRQVNQNEASLFFKDDWKFRQSLTLNLGLRWDYYGPAWVSNGLTAVPVGGGNALFGYSGRGFQNWMQPGQRGANTQIQLVGPGSPNPGISAWSKDYHNFGPAVGFAWQIPYFGAGQTTLRGGYQVSFLPGGGGRVSTLNGILANPPGSSYDASINQAPGLEYLDMTKLASLVPVNVPIKPLQPVDVTNRSVGLSALDPNLTNPYVQNLTLNLTRQVGRNLTLDARYIGTLSRKLYGSINLNSPDFLYNGLKEAFDAARSGGESPLLDQMFKGINLVGGAGTGPVGTVVGGVLQTGAGQLRADTASLIRNNLANGNYSALASTLNTLNYAGSNNPTLPVIPTNVLGAVLRNSGLFPENFIATNPQFTSATWQTNLGNTNYNSLQFQSTLRPTAGVNLQATYTWSKLLGRSGTFTNPVDRGPDYTLQTGDIRHDFRTNGIFNVPIGPGQLLLGKSSGVLARSVAGWQMGWIVDLSSGVPTSISAQSMLYANGVPDRVGPFNPHAGKVQWQNGALAGNFFGGAYKTVADPQCSSIASSLQSLCTLTAVANSSGTVVLQNPKPGTRGNLGQNVIENPGMWTLNTSMSKAFKIRESKTLRFRMDATNILNHPTPSNPTLSINSAPFGNIASKSGNRQFQAVMRLEF
ncbi:MAG TPA: TonB-dependent receptor [Terriglobia bacterium]